MEHAHQHAADFLMPLPDGRSSRKVVMQTMRMRWGQATQISGRRRARSWVAMLLRSQPEMKKPGTFRCRA
jgi:hypothetical protein